LTTQWELTVTYITNFYMSLFISQYKLLTKVFLCLRFVLIFLQEKGNWQELFSYNVGEIDNWCLFLLSCWFYPLQLHRVSPVRNSVDHVRERRRLQGGVDHPHPGAASGEWDSLVGRQLGFGAQELEHPGTRASTSGSSGCRKGLPYYQGSSRQNRIWSTLTNG